MSDMYRALPIDTPRVVNMPHGRYRLAEWLEAATQQGLLAEVEPTDRICTEHYTNARPNQVTCWRSEPTDPPCVMVDVVRISTTNPMSTESELVVETRESDEGIRDRVEGERLMNSDRREGSYEVADKP